MGQSLCLGTLLGAEQFGGRTLRHRVFSGGYAGHSQLPRNGPQGESLPLGMLYRLPPGLLGKRRRTVQRVVNRLPLTALTLDGCTFHIGLLLIGRIKGSQELPLSLIQMAVGRGIGNLLEFRAGGAGSSQTPQR